MINQGVLPHVRLSQRRIRVPRAAFDAWLSTLADRAIESMRQDG
jgi:hypothetical protein